MKAYNLFTGKTDDATLTASDGSAAGVSETLNGISDGRVIVSVINPDNVSVTMFASTNRIPYVWVPIGDATTVSDQYPLSLQSGNAYHFEASGSNVEVYVRPATDCVEFDGSEAAGLG